MNIDLSIPQLTAIEQTYARLTQADTVVGVGIELPERATYVRVTFTAAWGGSAQYDIDGDGNIAQVNGGESEISVEETPDDRPRFGSDPSGFTRV